MADRVNMLPPIANVKAQSAGVNAEQSKMKNQITLPYKPRRGRKKQMKYLQMMVTIRGMVQRCCHATGYTYLQIREQKPRDRNLRQARLALSHVILAARIESKYASEASGMSLASVYKCINEARSRYKLDNNFKNLCNAIAGKN